MDYKTLSNSELICVAKTAARDENQAMLEVITIIREVDRRKAYLELGRSSLFAFVTIDLKYDESAALRRINAARILRDLPEVQDKIISGALNLSTLNSAQQFFRKESKKANVTLEKKKAVLSSLENKSTRETQKTLLALSPENREFQESQKVVSESLTELKIHVDDRLFNDLKRLKTLLAHKNSNMSYVELLRAMADIVLKKVDPTVKAQAHVARTQKAADSRCSGSSIKPMTLKKTTIVSPEINSASPFSQSPAAPQEEQMPKTSRYIPAPVRHHVWLRDQGSCTFKEPLTKRRCGSTFRVQFHHKIAFAMGGSNTADNITLHCSEHNFHQAVKDFGVNKMNEYRQSF